MKNYTKEQVLEMMAQHPDVNWDEIDSLSEKTPRIFKVRGKFYIRTEDWDGHTDSEEYEFDIDKEFETREKAEQQIERMKSDPMWQNERLDRSYTKEEHPYTKAQYSGPVVEGSLYIAECTPDWLLELIYIDFLRREKGI